MEMSERYRPGDHAAEDLPEYPPTPRYSMKSFAFADDNPPPDDEQSRGSEEGRGLFLSQFSDRVEFGPLQCLSHPLFFSKDLNLSSAYCE